MDLRNLRAFQFVGKYGSVKRAAAYLKLTSPAISLQLKKLEKDLRVRLFERLPNKLVLTEQGAVLLRETRHVLDALTKLENVAAQGAHLFSGKLTIALGSDLPKSFAPPIAAFSQKHPNLRMTILSRYPREVLPLIADGSIDAAIGWFPKMPPDIEKKSLVISEMHLVFPPNHPIGKLKNISLVDTTKHRLILHTSPTPTRKLVDAAFHRQGIEVDNILEAGTCDTIMEFVELGLGIGFVHDTCLLRQRRDLRSLNMTDEFETMEVSVIYKKLFASKPLHRSLIGSLLSPSKDLSKWRKTRRK